jgi:hypothetical protein
MNRHRRFRTRGPLALGAGQAAASLGSRLRRAHQSVRGRLPIQLRWRRAPNAGSGVHAFTRQIISVTWAPQIRLHLTLAQIDRRPSIASVVHAGVSTSHHHVQRVWNVVRTTAAWRLSAHEASERYRGASRVARVPAIERRADAFGSGVAPLSMCHTRPVAGRQLLTLPVVHRSTERTLTECVVQRHADVFRTGVASSMGRTSAITMHRLRTTSVARRPTERTPKGRFIDPMLHSDRRAPVRPLGGAARRALLGRNDDRHSYRTGLVDPPRRVTHRPLELTWRRSTQSAAGQTPSTPIEAPFAGAPSPGRSSLTQSASASVVTSGSATDPARPFNLDASQLDRLTDDVIRRVDRRVRIARERRGL